MQVEGRVRFMGGNRFICFGQHRYKNFLWALIKGIYLLGGQFFKAAEKICIYYYYYYLGWSLTKTKVIKFGKFGI